MENNVLTQFPERLYPNELPTGGELVVVKITKIGDDMIYCHMLDYDREGMLPYKEVSRKKIRNIRRFIHIGTQECMEVIDVDNDKGYVVLTRKQIKDEDKEECSQQYISARRMHTFFYRWSVKSGENLVENILWKHYDPDKDDVYEELVTDQSWQESLPEEYAVHMKDEFYKMFEKKAVKHELNVEMACYSSEGVNALQEAINKGLEHSTKEYSVQCIYTGRTGSFGNIFQLSTVTKNDDGMQVLETVAEVMKESLSRCTSRVVIG